MKLRTRSLVKVSLIILAVWALLLPSAPVRASYTSPLAKPLVHLGPQGPTDPQEMEAFFDSVLPEQMEAHHVAGAAVSVVVDGELFFAKGYGYADVANAKPIEVDTTLFYIGSVHKLITWTAVMQLVEKDQLDLHADINAYLDFEIPATYPEPITLAHLMSHTPGFEQVFFGTSAPSAEELAPLGPWLAAHIPARVRPPGEIAAYTNYGTVLAGYIVERVSGVPYDQYVEQNVLGPLGMEYSSTRPVVPDHLTSGLSLGYGYVDGRFEVQNDPFYFSNESPASSMVSTATDMARFMIAHLNNGQIGGTRILEEAMARQMHSRLFTHDERLEGWAHGFQECHRAGQRALAHGGATNLFHAELVLLPEHGVGLYVSTNSESGGAVKDNVIEAFMDHYYPAPAETVAPFHPTSAQALAPIAGIYRPGNMARSTAEKSRFLPVAVSVQVVGDGELLVTGLGEEPRFVEVAPLVFEPVGMEDWSKFHRMTIREDAGGNVTHLLFTLAALERVPGYETPAFSLLLVAVCILLLLSAVIAAAIAAVVRRIRGTEPPPRPARVARWLLVAFVALFVLFVVGFAGFMDQTAAMYGQIPGHKATLSIPVLMAVLAAGAVVYTVLAWKRRVWRVAGRIHYTLATLAAVALIWFFTIWNLFGWW